MALILAALGACGGWIAWQFGPYGKMVVLPRMASGRWIRYDHAPRFQIRPRVALPSRFRTTFELEQTPATAVMRVCAYQTAAVEINGHPIVLQKEVQRGWKRPLVAEVGRWLRAGENRLEVEVVCDRGPPLLWLVIQGGDGDALVESGPGWQASWAGAEWREARLANVPDRWHCASAARNIQATERPTPFGVGQFTVPVADLTRHELNARLIPAVMWWQHRRWWLTLAVVLIAAWAIALYWGRGRNPRTAEAIEAWRFDGALLLGVAVLWGGLIWHNRGHLYHQAGYDASGHLQYIQYILDHHSLPLATDGWQMYQPPLYYILNAMLLGVAGLSTRDSMAVALLRFEGAVIGVSLTIIVWQCLKRLFPDRPRRWRVGGLLAAFLPILICLAHYPTNELLAALFCALVVYFVLLAIEGEEAARDKTTPSWVLVAIGVTLGLAMLSKITALVLVAATPIALGARLLMQRQRALVQWVRTIGVPLVVCLLVCGWHFGRVWYFLGVVFPSNAEFSYPLWQDPGYLTLAFFKHIGEVWQHPFDAAVVSFADGLLSTWWGDGAYGGTASSYLRPPWNYEWMTAGYLWALLPMACLLVGLVCAVGRFVYRPTMAWLFLGAAACGMLVILLHVLIVVPTFSFVKGFYALPLLVPFCALVGWGFDVVAAWHRAIAVALWIGLLLWAANSYLSFWIDAAGPTPRLMQAQAAVLRGDYPRAAKLYTALLKENPRNTSAWYHMATTLLRTNQVDRARRAYRKLLAIAPDHAQAHVGLAMALAKTGDIESAISEVEQGLELGAGAGGWPQFLLGQLLDEKGDVVGALRWYRRALRYTPHNAALHRHVANACVKLGLESEATQHLAWAKAVESQHVIDR